MGLPTETVYGVGVMPRPEALQALLAAKQRPADKGIALLIDDLDQVDDLVVVGAVGPPAGGALLAGPTDAGAAAPTACAGTRGAHRRA